MKKVFFSMATALLVTAAMFTSCTKDVEDSQLEGAQLQDTRAYGDKSPKVMVYVETNDNNPLIALSYHLGTSATGPVFIDILNLFASNIHKDAGGYPTLYLNDKMTRLLEPDPGAPTTTGYHKYVKPLQNAGMKVLLSSLGDWQGIGVANLTPAKADRFADILVYAVDRYGLDGITFDDEYANYTSILPGSYSHVIKALRAKLDTKFGVGNKLITVFQWGNTYQIDATAGAMLDYADHGTFGANSFASSSSISGMTNNRWMPQAINIGSSYNANNLNYIRSRSATAQSGNYGGIMMFNMRRVSNVSPLPVFQSIAQGAFNSTVTYDGTDYTQDWNFIPSGYTITKDDVPQYAPLYQ